MSNFNYCPLILMFCGKDANASINRVHKRALRIMWKDILASFAELLARGNERIYNSHSKFAKINAENI